MDKTKPKNNGGRPSNLSPASLESEALRLVMIARRVDESAKQYRQARRQLLTDVKHFNDVMEKMKRTLKHLVESDAD